MINNNEINIEESLKRMSFFNELEKVEKMFEEYEETFKLIGINVKDVNGNNKDVIKILTEMARQLYNIQLKLYDLERKQ